MAFPPGLRFLFRRLPTLLKPPTFVYLSGFICSRFLGITISNWLLIAGCVLSLPFALTLSVLWYDYANRKAAAAHGAVVPPYVKSKPGGFDILAAARKDKFIGHNLFRNTSIYGNIFYIRVMYQDRIFTSEPEYIKTILATDFPGYEKGAIFREQMKTLLGIGVFNADDMQKMLSIKCGHVFKKVTLSTGRRALSLRWSALPPTANITQENTNSVASQFSEAFLSAQEDSASRGRYQQAWPLVEFWKDKVEAKKQFLDDYINPILKEALEKKASMGEIGASERVSEDDTLLSHLLKVTDDAQYPSGRPRHHRMHLTFAVYRLSQHPDMLQRLREEILSQVGPFRRPTYEDIRNMKYLRAVINETLRLYPPVPFNVRTALKDTARSTFHHGRPQHHSQDPQMHVLCVCDAPPDRFMGPRWCVTIASLCAVVFKHPVALHFDPDRFLDERVQKYLTHNPFIFLPFNAGPRICLGQQFAYNEVSFMLIRLLQQVSTIELTQEVCPASVPPPDYHDSLGSDGTDKVWLKSHLTMYVKSGLWLKMGVASAQEAV
ncbi:hypothetical protein A0H81_11023 [Grifola frondosa]|uniref:Cytochrome P450 n=1 Tax=Grifola frondosa TaxID=5627 RepID=A0A1C7LVZ7_GRIFR|nr:hypothetical protein A0H81_11023 [Grifola frondosa]